MRGIVLGMDVITTVLGTGAWVAGMAVLVVMAMLPWLEKLGQRR